MRGGRGKPDLLQRPPGRQRNASILVRRHRGPGKKSRAALVSPVCVGRPVEKLVVKRSCPAGARPSSADQFLVSAARNLFFLGPRPEARPVSTACAGRASPSHGQPAEFGPTRAPGFGYSWDAESNIQVLCIEQKNGPLLEGENGLVKAYGESRKNVNQQILRTIGNIREKFGFQWGPNPGLAVEYLIYCPDYAAKNLNAAAMDRARIVDAPQRELLGEQIQTILPPGQPPADSRQAERVESFFRQTFEVVPDVHAHIGAQEKNFIRLSGGLVEVLDNIEMAPLRLRVLATAGNGKTLVACHFFAKALAAGKRPLLLCFNRPLAERLKRLVHSGGKVETWYGFCDQFLQSRGIRLDFQSMGSAPGFWGQAAQQVMEEALRENPEDDWQFDTLLIDEAQDFEAGWFDIVRLFLRDGSSILWLEDPNQNLRGVDPLLLQDKGFVGYRSMLNYRSPERIARFIAQVLPEFPFTCANDLPGLGYGIHPYSAPQEQPRLVGKIVGRLLAERFKPQQIAILSCRGLASTVLQDLKRVGNYTLSHFTGEYDLFGNQICSEGQILFDTVRRFKGQEQAAVILTDVEPRESRLEQELQVLFCGMTRATVRLEVVCNETNPWVAEHLLPAG